jgi:hypothetical protein
MVFILSLMIAGMLFGGMLTTHAGPMLLSLAMALMLTALVVTAIWWFTRRPVDPGEHVNEVQK